MSTPSSQMNFPPPGVDPAQWYDLQRQQMLAQALTQSAFTPPTTRNYGAARSPVSPLEIPLKMVQALMAKRAMAKAAQTGQSVYGQGVNAFGDQDQGPPPSAAADSGNAPPPTSAVPPASPDAGVATSGTGPSSPVGPTPSPVGPAPGGAPPQAGAPSVPMSPSPSTAPGGTHNANPMNPLGLPPALAFRMWMSDPNKYGELIAGTPEWRTALSANGGNVQAAQAALRAQLQKAGSIDLRPGGEVILPSGQRVRNPNLPSGVEPTYGADGSITGSRIIPGVASAEETLAGAGARGKAENELHPIPTGVPGQERTQFGLTGIPGAPSAPGTPPGMPGSPGAPRTAPAPPQYFPPHTLGGAPGGAGAAGGGLPGGPQGGAQGPDWWPGMPRVQNQEHLGYTAGDYQEKLADLRAKKAGDYITQFGLEADTADQKLEYSSELLRNLPRAYTGPQAQGVAGFWNAVNQVPGIRNLIPQGTTQDAAGTQIAVKNLVNQAIQGARALYGQRMTQSEVMLQKNEASPSITMGLQAIYALQRQEDAKSAYFVQRKQDFDQFMQEGGDPLRFEGSYQRQFPLAKFATAYATRNAAVYQPPKEIAPPKSIQNLIQQPETRQDFITRYGYLPPDVRQ